MDDLKKYSQNTLINEVIKALVKNREKHVKINKETNSENLY